jgi:hypothetical protein
LHNSTRDAGRDWSIMVSPAPEILSAAGIVTPSLVSADMSNSLIPHQALIAQRRVSRDAAVVVVKWNDVTKEVCVRIGLTGVDLCLDAEVVPELRLWTSMVSSALADASRLHHAASKRGDDTNISHLDNQQYREYRILIDPVAVRFSARAPSPESQRHGDKWISPLRKAVQLVIGSEYVSDIVLHAPLVDVHGSFAGPGDMAARVGREFGRAMASRMFLVQIGWQIPALMRLGRVASLSYLRSSAVPEPSSRSGFFGFEGQGDVGLLVSTDSTDLEWQHKQHIVLHTSTPEYERARTPPLQPAIIPMSNSMEMIDCATRNAGTPLLRKPGRGLFDYLRTVDKELRESGETFISYVPYRALEAIIVTSSHVLAIRLVHADMSAEIVPPRLPIETVSGHAVRGRMVDVYCWNMKCGALSRDTRTLLESILTLECDDEEAAEEVARVLPGG